MKKVMVIFTMMILVISMVAIAHADRWDDVTIGWLDDNTVEWCNTHGYEDWIDMHHYDNDMILGHGVIHDVTPDYIRSDACAAELEEGLGIKIHSIDLIHYGQEGGYDIYRLIVKWNEPKVTAEEFGSKPIYGEDMFVRFYN